MCLNLNQCVRPVLRVQLCVLKNLCGKKLKLLSLDGALSDKFDKAIEWKSFFALPKRLEDFG